MSDKKELKEKYKYYKPDMGLIAFKVIDTGKIYLSISQNTKADINSLVFRMNLGVHFPNSNFADDWKKYGQTGFDISVLEKLEYEKDETKIDYTEDLKLLREITAEKLNNYEFI